MNGTSRRLIIVSALFAAAAAVVSAGGWSIITVDDFPDYARTGTPLRLTFSVRQHGNRLVNGLTPTIRASSAGSPDIIVRASPTTNPGEYAATLALPRSGDWTLLVDGGFNPDDRSRQHNSVALPTLRVTDDSTAAVPALSESKRGGRLMVAKGCVGCHQPGSERDVTTKPYAAGYLEKLLADPSVRTPDMPNLDLKAAEISALIAFINAPRDTRHRTGS